MSLTADVGDAGEAGDTEDAGSVEVRVLVMPGDYQGSVRFWTEGVGLAVHETFDDAAGVLLALGPGVYLELLAAPPGEGPVARQERVQLSVRVTDADAAHRRLARRALRPSEPVHQPWGHRSFEVADPDGHRLTLFEVLGG